MTKYSKYLCAMFGAALLVGCADTDIDTYSVEKPQTLAEYEYLNAYGPLKSYLENVKAANPDFMLGTGVLASDYNKKGLVYRLTNSNFDQITAGNAMKYASIVKDDGTMDFSTVQEFVENAKAAGISVYGHTLCWHEQQNVKWLNKLIADRELEVDPDNAEDVLDMLVKYSDFGSYPYYRMWDVPQIENGILVINNVPAVGADWQGQYFVIDGAKFVKGNDYLVTAKIKGSSAGSLNVNVGDWGGQASARLEFTDQWEEVTISVKGVPAESGFVIFQSGAFEGKLEIEWVKLHHNEAPVMEVETEVKYHTYTDGPFPYYPMGCEPPVINGAMHFEPTGNWSQFFILPGGENKLAEGDYVVYLDITSDQAASGIQLTMQNGWGGDAQNITVPVSVEAGRQKLRLKFYGITGGNYDMILKPQTAPATLDVHSITICRVEQMNKIPLTPEEKAEVLTNEMERWIAGCMEATGGYVKAWDVVNEAISGGPWGQRYDLQTGVGSSSTNQFFWQDYLGENFVRIPVKFARQYFEENGGNPADLKLFINDYNLESDWDDNQKLKSLISWIEQWESDGVTKIDGIGTQMHVSCYTNPDTQASKKAHITKMFELIAASGKMCRITELDMGFVDENGQSVKTKDMTFEQHQMMAEYYRFIVSEYLRVIPAAQQYGICTWCQTDAPDNSGWRGGEPVGLWDANYSRKPAYGGFADGLAGK